MTLYALLKLGHIAFVVITGALFLGRFALLNAHPDRPLARPLKIVPHINDTLLLGCAVGMLILSRVNPFTTPWLTAKLLALLGYIVAGAICLRAPPRSGRQRLSFVVAIALFGYILAVAFTRQLLPLAS